MWEDATTKYGFDKRRTYLLGKGLDSVMNYPFKNAVLDFVKGKPAEQAMGKFSPSVSTTPPLPWPSILP